MSAIRPIDLPFGLDNIVKVKITDLEKDFMSFMHRTRNDETVYKIKIPKGKLWEKANLSPGTKINLELVTSETSNRIQLSIHY